MDSMVVFVTGILGATIRLGHFVASLMVSAPSALRPFRRVECPERAERVEGL